MERPAPFPPVGYAARLGQWEYWYDDIHDRARRVEHCGDRLRIQCDRRKDLEARRRGGPGVLRIDSAAGRRGDRSDGLDGLGLRSMHELAVECRGASRSDSENRGTPAETLLEGPSPSARPTGDRPI